MPDSPDDYRVAPDRALNSDGDPDEEGFRSLTGFVERELEFATSHYNDDYLKRRFASRMRRRGVSTYGEYLEVVTEEPDEQRALLDALSINVTGFFRDPEVWEGVREILRALTEQRLQVTAWSAGCADGREPYSLAMLADADPEIEAASLVITATDISEAAIDSAREGVYQGSHTTDIRGELDFLENPGRYVESVDGDRYAVVDRIRRAVTFQQHDLIRDDPKTDLDLVLCRNLTIYIDSEYKEPVIDTVRRSLRPGGYLVIGKTETIPRSLRDDFTVVDGERRIYRRTVPDEDGGRSRITGIGTDRDR